MQSKKRVEQLSLVQDPQKVKVLILTDQKTSYSDFYFIAKFTNIIKLDLSYNKISNFTVGFSFKSFQYLRTLFLHYNKFNSLKAIQCLSECHKLQYLTLFGNPLEETKTRHYFVNEIQSLKLMDDKIIKMQQRNPQIISSNSESFIRLSFPIVPIQNSKGSVSFLSAVITELKIIRQKFLEVNPIIKIQRWYKKVLAKRKIKVVRKSTLNMQQSVIQKLQTDMQQQIASLNQLQNKKRLITEKLPIHNSKQQKVLSLLLMNMEFLNFLRLKSHKKVFAIREFCQTNGLKYQKTNKKLICLRLPEKIQYNGKGHLQLLIKSCQAYLLRRRGSEQSMNYKKKYSLLPKLLQKRKIRQSKYFQQIQKCNPNPGLSDRIQKIQSNYLDKFVLLNEEPSKIYECMKQHFFKSLNNKTLFPFCLQQIVQRSAAALSIQRMWRGYIVRKKTMNSVEQLTKNNAAWLIQRFIRNIGLKKRSRMFIQLISYIKSEAGSNQLIIRMQDVLRIQRVYRQLEIGVNFVLDSQKITIKINALSGKIELDQQQFKKFPKYVRNYVNTLQNQSQLSKQMSKQSSNSLDLFFKGAKSVKYFSIPTKSMLNNNKIQVLDKKQKSPQKTLLTTRSISALGNSGVVVINKAQKKDSNISDGRLKMNDKQAPKQNNNSQSLVVLEYQNSRQTINRKFILALISFKFQNNKFIRSIKVNINENSRSTIKNINDRVNQNFILRRIPESSDQSINLSQINLLGRQQSNPIKLKFFVNQQQYPAKVALIYPLLMKSTRNEGKIQGSMTLPVRSIQNLSSIKHSQNGSARHSAHIAQKLIKMYPNQKTQQDYEQKQEKNEGNFMSYRQFESYYQKKYKHKFKNRYEDLQSTNIKNKSLQKSQSLQPATKRQLQNIERQRKYFQIVNQNLQKNYKTSSVYNNSVTQNIISNQGKDKNMQYSSLLQKQTQKQMKKHKILLIKQSHHQKIQENNRYKKQQLIKLRQKLIDQTQQNNRIIQSNKLDSILSNARRHNMVKQALSRKKQQMKSFQRDFLKRGNTSIRKDMIKFQHDRSSKSPDNQSVYQSLKSLQSQALKNKIIKHRNNKIFNLKTQIKEFSIDGSQGQQLSMGVFQSQNKSKGLSKKSCSKEHQKSERSKQRHLTGRLKNTNKQMKKKKVVHSVFPQQFYPLKQSKKIGFQLPRINKK